MTRSIKAKPEVSVHSPAHKASDPTKIHRNGSGKGAWGSNREEIDAAIAAVRSGYVRRLTTQLNPPSDAVLSKSPEESGMTKLVALRQRSESTESNTTA